MIEKIDGSRLVYHAQVTIRVCLFFFITLLSMTVTRFCHAQESPLPSLDSTPAIKPIVQSKKPPMAIKGVLDLSQWDFETNGPVALSGEYEFYWQQHLAPERFSQPERPKMSGFIRVPGIWNGYELDGKKLSGEGYATYRLRVRLKEPAPLSLKFLDMATAFTVYLNGTKLFSAGVPGKTPEATVPQYFPQVVDFTPASGQLEIIFHVANFHHQKGGAWEPIKLGLPNDLHQARALALQLDILLFGCIVIMGLYHLGLFAVRTNERAPLYFGIFCLLIALRLIAISERLLLQFFPHLSWELLGKIEYLAYYLAVPTGAMFLHALYREDFPQFILRTIQAISTVFCGIVLFTPVRIFSHTVSVHHAYTILSCSYGVFVIVLSTVRRREGAKINLVGFSILFLAILNDILNYFYLIHTPLLLPFGLLAFIFSQAVLLSFRFSKAFRTVDWQRFELEKANRQYENELIERKRLEEQYRALYDDNPTMYFTVDANGTVLSVNQFGLEYLGYHAEELMGQPVLKVFHEDDKTLVRQQLATCLQNSHRVHDWELRKIRKDGSMLWVKEFARCVQNPAGQALVLIVCEDITARKQAEEELRTSRERLRALGAHLQALLEQERVAIAKDLHDELGQTLASLKMDLSLLERQVENADGRFDSPTMLHEIGSMQKLVVAIINKVRSVITELRPAILDTLGLVPALEWQLEEFHKRTGLAYEFHAAVKDLEIAKEYAVAVFRIFQESLANIARHAHAGNVKVSIAKHDHTLWVDIVDNGRGISSEELNVPGKFGLLGMRERALVFGGEVEITGMPGRGTTVKIKIPLPD
jgi:PAS domain S-box-containing protein